MHNKRKVRHHQRVTPWWYRIPRLAWIVLEVLVTVVVLHANHIPLHDFLQLFKLLLS